MSNESPESTPEHSVASSDAGETKSQANVNPQPESAAQSQDHAQNAPPAANDPEKPEAATSKPRIQVGSRSSGGVRPSGDRPPVGDRRPAGDRSQRRDKPRRGSPKSDKQEDAESDATPGKSNANLFVDAPRANVPVPSKRDGLTPELEMELNAALGDVSLDQIVQEGVVGRATQPIEQDTRMRATVMRVAGDNVFLSLGGRNEGVVSARQFKDPPTPGMELDVVVKSFHTDDGLYELLVPGASVSVADWSDLTSGAVVEARITGANTGGLECMVNTIRGFIPASQIGLFRVADFADYLNQKLLCLVTEVNPRRKNLVLSHRAVLEREKEEARKQLLEQLQPGQIYEGVVRKIQDFGAFVDIGGVDGLVHVSQLSWDRINHPSEVIQEGQRVRVKVEKVNPQTGKISLSYRDLLDRPWDNIEEKFPVGAVVKGPVSRVAKFGAFVKLAPGVEGLIHISELAHGRVRRVEDVLKESQEVEVKVLSVDLEAQRIALSLKANLPPPEMEVAEGASESPDESARPLAVPRRNRPLRGGLEGPSSGEQYGLNW